MEGKIAYLGFIQNIITRMNANSFLIKGWCITIVSALLALSIKNWTYYSGLLAYLPLFAFWYLDSIYLGIEKQYRALYKDAAAADGAVSFSLDVRSISTEPCLMWSKTLRDFYGTLFVLMSLWNLVEFISRFC